MTPRVWLGRLMAVAVFCAVLPTHSDLVRAHGTVRPKLSMPILWTSSEFAEHPLGHTPIRWLPVDLDGNGLWESVFVLDAIPPMVGIYDASTAEWTDGPRELGPAFDGGEVGVSDLDKDGSIEYFYMSGSDVHRFDIESLQDSTLWEAPFTPDAVLIWGVDQNGSSVIALRHSHYDCPSGEGYGREWHQWDVHDLNDGELLRSIDGSSGRPRFAANCPEPNATSLIIYEARAEYQGYSWVGWSDFFHKIHVVDSQWNTTLTRSLPKHHIPGWGPCHETWSFHDACFVPGYAQKPGFVVWRVHDFRQALPNWFGSHSAVDGSYGFRLNGGDRVAGLGFADFDADGSEDLISVDWEWNRETKWIIRDPETGEPRDTLHGWPRVDLRNGPLLSPGGNDLFYISADTLYIWQPTPTGILDEWTDASSEPATVTLHVAPNPFNASVRLSWDAGSRPERVVIYDILGRVVRTLHVERGAAQVEWDGRNRAGRRLASGVYFARPDAPSSAAITKLVLLR